MDDATSYPPIVSIIVITYNSSNYVLDTLESAKNQTYENIELIISDDASTDQTVSLCKEWLSQNKERFLRTEMIAVAKNSGTSTNCNRGLNAVQGDWIKLIAGDDLLMQDCIECNVEHSKHSISPLFFSDLEFFNEQGRLKGNNEQKYLVEKFVRKSQKEKTKSYIRNAFFLNTPSFFIKHETIRSLGGFDENIKLLEDQPFVINLLMNNYDIDYFKKTTVKYRVHNLSVVGKRSKVFIHDLYKSYRVYRRPFLNNFNLLDMLFKLYNDFQFYLLLNGLEKTFFFKAFLKVFSVLRKLN